SFEPHISVVCCVLIANARYCQCTNTPPVCPSKDCSKVITFYNNTPTAIFPVIQAGIQNPDPWLQALFNDDTKTYAETHYSRAYINPVNGIPPGGHIGYGSMVLAAFSGRRPVYRLL